MRIADKMNYEQVKSNLSKNRSDMAELQNQAALQKRVTKPSDDPLAATRILATRTEVAGNNQFLKNVGQARAFLEFSDQSLGELSELLMRAKELAISQSNDASANDRTRDVAATEIEQLFNQAVQVGNRKYGDRFLFGGFKTTRAPFDPNGNYRGDAGEMKIWINKEAAVGMNISGDKVFLGVGLQAPSYAGPEENGGRDSKIDPRPDRGNDPYVRPNNRAESRGPASVESSLNGKAASEPQSEERSSSNLTDSWNSKGVSVFKVLGDLETGLRANDKESVQESLDRLDEAIAQVVLSRAQLGSRVSTLNNAQDTLQKGNVDAKGLASNLEDVDTFELVSDLNKTESTLKASLATSGKLIQPSLLDFLR